MSTTAMWLLLAVVVIVIVFASVLYKRTFTVHELALTGVMAALSLVAYLFFRVPFYGGSSFHLGNTFTALTALLLDGVSGGLAGAIGLALADILAGDPGYAVTTFVLKFIIGITCVQSLTRCSSSVSWTSTPPAIWQGDRRSCLRPAAECLHRPVPRLLPQCLHLRPGVHHRQGSDQDHRRRHLREQRGLHRLRRHPLSGPAPGLERANLLPKAQKASEPRPKSNQLPFLSDVLIKQKERVPAAHALFALLFFKYEEPERDVRCQFRQCRETGCAVPGRFPVVGRHGEEASSCPAGTVMLPETSRSPMASKPDTPLPAPVPVRLFVEDGLHLEEMLCTRHGVDEPSAGAQDAEKLLLREGRKAVEQHIRPACAHRLMETGRHGVSAEAEPSQPDARQALRCQNRPVPADGPPLRTALRCTGHTSPRRSLRPTGGAAFRLSADRTRGRALPAPARRCRSSPRSGTRGGLRPSPCCRRGPWYGCSAPAADASSPLWPGRSCGQRDISVRYPRQAVRRTAGSTTGRIPLPSHFLAVVLDGSRRAAAGVHILLKAGELLLRRAAADEHEARVFVLRRDIIAAAAVIAAGLLCLGGAGRTAAPLCSLRLLLRPLRSHALAVLLGS